MFDGKVERFSDIGELITQWERIAQDDNEWMVEEGIRRGGRSSVRGCLNFLGYLGRGRKTVELDWTGLQLKTIFQYLQEK